MDVIATHDHSCWEAPVSALTRRSAQGDIEHGRVVYFPGLRFPLQLDEAPLLSAQICAGRSATIRYDAATGCLKGVRRDAPRLPRLAALLRRFAETADRFVRRLFPAYAAELALGETRLTLGELAGRKTTLARDESRLHWDAFPAWPTQGGRLLRVVANIHRGARTADWRLGERFAAAAPRYLRFLRPPAGSAALPRLGSRRIPRSLYDHYMLRLRYLVLADDEYQQTAPQVAASFPAGSSWLYFSDEVLHAEVGGQHLVEQTFLVPVATQRWPERSPLRVLERLTGQVLAMPDEPALLRRAA